MDYYGPRGETLSRDEWAALFEDRGDLPHWISHVRGGWPWNSRMVSTVWIGLDHSPFGSGPPLTWETMVFPEGTWDDLYCQRYTTEEQAWEGHQVVTEMYEVEASGHLWNRRQMRSAH